MIINDEINEIKRVILETVPALQIYLFGSYAKGTQREDSDYDFYVVIPDDSMRPLDAAYQINLALHPTQKRSVDMLVGNKSKFDKYKHVYSVENEVMESGVRIYG